MKNSLLKLGLFALLPILFSSCNNSEEKTANDTTNDIELQQQQLVEHGQYLVEIMGCNDCHSPKRMGQHGPEIIPELLLSGFQANSPMVDMQIDLIKQGFGVFYPDLTAAAGPWGVSFAANLTPDETGLGSWTEEQFTKALTQGKFKGMDQGRMLLPPMPWFNYTKLKKDDIHAIFTYHQSINPVKNVVPSPLSPKTN